VGAAARLRADLTRVVARVTTQPNHLSGQAGPLMEIRQILEIISEI